LALGARKNQPAKEFFVVVSYLCVGVIIGCEERGGRTTCRGGENRAETA
jgi:hypothetical protein